MIQYSIPFYGKPAATVRKVAGDTAKSLSDHSISLTSGSKKAVAAVISVETNDLRLAFAATPTQVGNKLGHKYGDGQTVVLMGPEVDDAKFINDTNGSDAVMQITVLFE